MVTFETLPRLPGTGPRAKPFSSSQKAWLKEGLVVRFTPNSGNSWVGNFQPGTGGATAVLRHPDGERVVVFAAGQVYVVDADARSAAALPGAALNVHVLDDPPLLIYDDQGIQFQALGRNGLQWRTKRISWEGFRNVVLEGSRLTGESVNAARDTWETFLVDLGTGKTNGGTYLLADAAFFEVIGTD